MHASILEIPEYPLRIEPLPSLDLLAGNLDDPTAYAVYADLLEQRDHPLATYLGNTLFGSPTSDWEKERSALFPSLSELADTSLLWSFGFIEAIEIKSASPARARKELATVLRCPLSVLVREIVVRDDHASRASFDYNPVVATLQTATLPCLRRLRLGLPGEFPIPNALRDRFPGVGAEEWSVVRERVAAAQGRLKHRFDLTTLPDLVPIKDGAAKEDDLDLVILGLRRELEKKRVDGRSRAPDLGLIPALRAHFTAASLDAFVTELARQWADDETTTTRVGFEALRSLGGDRATLFLRALPRTAGSSRDALILDALDVIGSPLATVLLYEHANTAEGARRERARGLLERRANASGLTIERLLDDVSPRLSPMHREHLFRVEGPRLERMMIDGHRVSLSDFERCYLEAPLRGELLAKTPGLVFGFFAGEEVLDCARLEKGQLLRADGSRLHIAEHAEVGVVHPAELSGDALATWKSRGDVVPWQLERPIARPGKYEDGRRVLIRELTESRAGANLWNLRERGWRDGRVEFTEGPVLSLFRDFPRDDVTMTIDLKRRYEGRIDLYPRGSSGFLDLHPVTQSELLVTLKTFSRPSRKAHRAKRTARKNLFARWLDKLRS